MTSRLGQEGQEGAPGEPGRGGGGSGGKGGKGGRGADLATGWKRWKALIGYFGIVLVAVIVVTHYQVQTNRKFDRRDAKSCSQRNRLASNQRAVIGALAHVLVIEIGEQKHGPLRNELQVQLADIQRRLLKAGPESC